MISLRRHRLELFAHVGARRSITTGTEQLRAVTNMLQELSAIMDRVAECQERPSHSWMRANGATCGKYPDERMYYPN